MNSYKVKGLAAPTTAGDAIRQTATITEAALGSAISKTAGHTIQDEGTPLTARANLNFIGAGVTATDNAGTGATDVTIPGGGLFSVDISGDLEPVLDIVYDQYYDLDENDDLQPKTT